MTQFDITPSQRKVMSAAAKLANKAIQKELNNPESPISQVVTKKPSWIIWSKLWNPFIPNWAKFGLSLRDSDAVLLNSNAAYERANEIASQALTQTMQKDPKVWLGPMLQDLIDDDSYYEKFVTDD